MNLQTTLALLALGASTLATNSQDPGVPSPSLLMRALDANHDGVIDAGEIANASAALKTLDKNGDGRLTYDELRPFPNSKNAGSAVSDSQTERREDGKNSAPAGPRPNGHRPPPSALMRALDANHDGVIDAAEIANAPAALKTLDTNGDGKLTPDELSPDRSPRDGGFQSQ